MASLGRCAIHEDAGVSSAARSISPTTPVLVRLLLESWPEVLEAQRTNGATMGYCRSSVDEQEPFSNRGQQPYHFTRHDACHRICARSPGACDFIARPAPAYSNSSYLAVEQTPRPYVQAWRNEQSTVIKRRAHQCRIFTEESFAAHSLDCRVAAWRLKEPSTELPSE